MQVHVDQLQMSGSNVKTFQRENEDLIREQREMIKALEQEKEDLINDLGLIEDEMEQ